MTYFVVSISGRQFLLKQGYSYNINRISLKNKYLLLKKVLLYKKGEQVQIGKPFLVGASVLARIVQNFKGKKILILKTKPKKHYLRLKGHRQQFTRIHIL